jgi:hypothetical protein
LVEQKAAQEKQRSDNKKLRQSVATPSVVHLKTAPVSEDLISLSLPFRTLFLSAVESTK